MAFLLKWYSISVDWYTSKRILPPVSKFPGGGACGRVRIAALREARQLRAGERGRADEGPLRGPVQYPYRNCNVKGDSRSGISQVRSKSVPAVGNAWQKCTKHLTLVPKILNS